MINYLKKIVGWVTIVSLVLMLFPLAPNPSAATLTSAKVVITDSKPQATGVNYTFYFTAAENATSVTFTFDSTFTSRGGDLPDIAANYNCPYGWSLSGTTTNSYTCSGSSSSGEASSTITGVTNPTKDAPAGTADVYYVDIETNGGEDARVKFAIIEGVVVTATVDAILEFTISGVNAGTTTKNTTTNVTSTPTAIAFGTLPLTPSSTIAAQDLGVRTNASEGFFVYVFQDQDLTSAAGDKIHCFADGTCVSWSSTQAWSAPSGNLDDEKTWGHFGFTSEDTRVQTDGTCSTSTTGTYGATTDNKWAGFSGTSQAPVMCYPRPFDSNQGGKIRVGYQVEITALQPAGEYTNTLTYIATPTY